MFRIAHLSDVHLLEQRTGSYGFSVKFVSVQRPLDAEGRVAKMRRALATAKAAGADHLVVSGDLTETGEAAQFERFAEVLHDSGFAPEAVTLVPGNHDAYGGARAWRLALEGPLRAFASTSAIANTNGVAIDMAITGVERAGVALLPIDVTCVQSIVYCGGELTSATAAALERRLEDRALRDKAVVVVQHHPPFAPPSSVVRLVDGLRGYARLLQLLGRHPNVSLLHGHMHRVIDRIVGGIGRARVFGAPATVDDSPRAPRVRMYEVHDGALESVGFAPSRAA